ncbi:MFS transporter [Nocardioides sp. CBS4Y-1]|uniref:MFS transporter n=2 Tax=Nocardioides acrostichi TaxID=2784339 RepID=A0A930V078_9ACTN|nr:MFS transporter [Nocardioides acrostichi]
MVYEGMRSVTGPFLVSLGASALVVGLVTGAGEGVALLLRLAVGPAADRSGRHWRYATAGYGLTAVSVPLLALTPFLGAAGLAVACALVLAERTGKAVRSPSKSALLAGIAKDVGRGRGFAVHKALDQVGAFAGPLLVAGVALVAGHRLWAGLALLAVPGAVSMALLTRLRRRAPIEGRPPSRRADRSPTARLPRRFWVLAAGAALSTVGLMTFGVLSVVVVRGGVLSAAVVPVAYAGAMVVEAVAALGAGWAYDRVGAAVLLGVPVIVAGVPVLLLGAALPLTLATVGVGLASWGAATGLQDSVVKAFVADVAPSDRLGAAYGWFAAVQGTAAFVGGGVAGALLGHRGVLVVVLVTAQVAALVVFAVAVLDPSRRDS